MNVVELREHCETVLLEAQEELNELQLMIFIDELIKSIAKAVFEGK